MKFCLQKENKTLTETFEDDFPFLNEIFLQKNPDFLLIYNGTFKGNILILLPANFELKTQLKQQPSHHRLDIYYLSEICAGSVTLSKEKYDYFFLVSTEPESLDQFILALGLLFMSMKQGKGGRFHIPESQKKHNIHQEAILQGWYVDYQNEEVFFLILYSLCINGSR